MAELDKALTILVPQGAEYQAVCRGLRRIKKPPIVRPIPVGAAPVARYLKQLQQDHPFSAQSPVLLMGLCGGLTPGYPVAAGVLYQECVSALTGKSFGCDRRLTEAIQQRLALPQVRGVTSDRVITTPIEKQQLAQQYQAEVVDMEGVAALEFLHAIGVAVAMVRVVSDGCHDAIPDLSAAFDEEGTLQPQRLASSFLKEPVAAFHLIRGSLSGLKALQKLVSDLFLPA